MKEKTSQYIFIILNFLKQKEEQVARIIESWSVGEGIAAKRRSQSATSSSMSGSSYCEAISKSRATSAQVYEGKH